MTKRQDRVRRRIDMVRRFEGCGLSAAEFARREGISVATLTNWRKRVAHIDDDTGQSPAFLPVTVVEDPSSEAALVGELALPGGRRLQVAEGFHAEELVRLIKVLEAC